MASELTREDLVSTLWIMRQLDESRCESADAHNVILAHDAAQRAQREQDRQLLDTQRDFIQTNDNEIRRLRREAEQQQQRIAALEQEVAKWKGNATIWHDNFYKDEAQIETLTQALAQAKGALEETEHELQRIQWVRGADEFIHLSEIRTCPSCGSSQKAGHHAGCGLDAARNTAHYALAALAVPAAGGGEASNMEANLRMNKRPTIAELEAALNDPTCQMEIHPDGSVTATTEADRLRAALAAAPAPTPGLVWTTERPKVAGWYWWQSTGEPAIARLVDTEEGGLIVQFDNGHCVHLDAFMDRAKHLRWCGPIALPEPLQGA